MCRRACKICERDIVPQVVDPHPEDKHTVWETCPMCQRVLTALNKQAQEDIIREAVQNDPIFRQRWLKTT